MQIRAVSEITKNVTDILWFQPRNNVDIVFGLNESPDGGYMIGMSDEESAFLSGLIRLRSPQKILECGAHNGGTTAVILETLSLMSSTSKLHSVDLNKHALSESNIKRHFPQYNDNVIFYRGEDVSYFLTDIGKDIDMVILDAAHFVPGEILNFLTILPYLKEGATIILHDIALSLSENEDDFIKSVGRHNIIACRVLYDTVVAEKITPDFNWGPGINYPNIGSFIVNNDTVKYIENVLGSLLLPWRFMPSSKYLKNVLSNIHENYPISYYYFIKKVIHRQIKFIIQQEELRIKYFEFGLKEISETIGEYGFVGAGFFCKSILTGIQNSMHPKVIFDTFPQSCSGFDFHIQSIEAISKFPNMKVLIITSDRHHKEIEEKLISMSISLIIINPFEYPIHESSQLQFSMLLNNEEFNNNWSLMPTINF